MIRFITRTYAVLYGIYTVATLTFLAVATVHFSLTNDPRVFTPDDGPLWDAAKLNFAIWFLVFTLPVLAWLMAGSEDIPVPNRRRVYVMNDYGTRPGNNSYTVYKDDEDDDDDYAGDWYDEKLKRIHPRKQ